MNRRYCACILCAVVAAVAYFMMFGALPVASAKQPGKPVSFINDVAPILKENCFACHDAKKKSGKFDMTSFEKLMAGGANGDPIAKGKPEASDLHSLMVTKDQRRMPPRDKGEAVPKDKAAVVAQWIKEGAKLDTGLDAKADLVKELRVRWKPPVPPKVYPFPTIVNAVAFTPDGKQLVVGGHHELTVWAIDTGKLVKRIYTRAERAYGLAFLPDGKLVVAGGRPGQEGDVNIYDINAKGKTEDGIEILDGVNDPKVLVKHLFDVEDSVLCLSITPDGKTLAAGGCDRAVRIFDLTDGLDKAKLVQTVENHADWVLGCALSADGKYLVTAGRDKTAKVWDLKAKESVVTFPEHQNIVYGVAVKADGSVGFSVGADKQLRTWKPSGEGKQVKNAGGHTEDVFKIVAGPKDAIFATSSADKTVRLWDANLTAGKVLSGLTDYVYAVAFSTDGKLVAGGSYDGSVAVWKVADGSVVKAFNASPGIVTKEPEPKKK
jgi:Planctomycete cytochrome C/WD domain, G-beta repeat